MTLLKSKSPQNREKRLNALSAYLGDTGTLVREFGEENVTQKIRTFAQSSHDDLLYALRLISGIRDAVTVIHGPRGCAAAELGFLASGGNGRWAVTNLDERDTIMGADKKLRAAVSDLYRKYRPRVLFIVATPVVAINNDDIQSVVDELGEELDAAIVPVYAEGFKSKTAATGYDTASHSLLKYLVKSGGQRRDEFVNLISVSEREDDREELVRLLTGLGLTINTFPDGSEPADIVRSKNAVLSIAANPDFSDYLGGALEVEYQVPYLHFPRPIGIEGTGRWLSSIGEATGRTDEAAAIHARESGALAKTVEKSPLRGARVYVNLPTADLAGAIGLLSELGGEVAGATVEHLDRLHEGIIGKLHRDRPDLQLHAAHGQPFEVVNIVKRLAPDLYVGGSGTVGPVARLGVPVVSLDNLGILGYRGVANFARQTAKALRNTAFVRQLSDRAGLPYHDNWYRRSSNWHIKQEVK